MIRGYFDTVSLFLKSGRHWGTCYSNMFTDIFFLKSKHFHKVVNTFPEIKEYFLKQARTFELKYGLFSNANIFNLLKLPSSESPAKDYKKGCYKQSNIWKEIEGEDINYAYSEAIVHGFTKNIAISIKKITEVFETDDKDFN